MIYFSITHLKKRLEIATERRMHYRVNNSEVNLEQAETHNASQEPDIDNLAPVDNSRNLEVGATCSLYADDDYMDGKVHSDEDKENSANANIKSFIGAFFLPVFDRTDVLAKEEGVTPLLYNEVDHNVDGSADTVKSIYGHKRSIHAEYYEPTICNNVNPFEAETDGKKGNNALYYQSMVSRIPKSALDKKPQRKNLKVSFAKNVVYF